MGELLDYFKGKYGKKTSIAEDQILKVSVKNAISDLCEEHLLEAGYVLTFEVLPEELPYAVVVIEEEPLKSKYEISQVSKTLFKAMLREVEI